MGKIIAPKFSAPRHKAIASLADDFLKNAPAEKELKKILKKINAPNLKAIATWADDIKPTSFNKPGDKETKDFLKKFPDTREWHFVDLPVDATKYDVTKYAPFVREDDVVHTLVECIKILTGKSAKFSKPNALRWLVHLVGDIHQPLHIACSYIDFSKSKPELVLKKDDIISRHLLQKSDRGGNKINLPISKGKSLHSYWDGDLPGKDNDFAGAKYKHPAAVPLNKLTELPAKWVGENVQFAIQAYSGLKVKGKNATHPTSVDVTWNKTQYDKRCVPLVKELSLKAANRLTFLLRSIYE